MGVFKFLNICTEKLVSSGAGLEILKLLQQDK